MNPCVVVDAAQSLGHPTCGFEWRRDWGTDVFCAKCQASHSSMDRRTSLIARAWNRFIDNACSGGRGDDRGYPRQCRSVAT